MSEDNKLEKFKESAGALYKQEKLEGMFLARKAEGDSWNKLAGSTTPQEGIEYRVGSGGETFEYVTEEYCIAQLNRLFPGWSEEDCKVEYNPEVRNYKATGYLAIEWIRADGTKGYRRIFGVGGQKVQKSTSDPTDPVQPDDAAKGADTDRFKRCCKRLGIGLDVYAQMITPSMRQAYEDKVRLWEHREEGIYPIIKTISKRGVFVKFVENLPTEEQTKQFISLMEKISNVDTRKKQWLLFQKMTKDSAVNYLNTLEQKINSKTQGDSNA